MWAAKVRMYLGHSYPQAKDILDWAASNKDKITEETFGEHASEEMWDDDALEFSKFMYAFLVARTNDSPYRMVMNVEEGNGVEAWRVLCSEFNPHTVNSAQGYLRKILAFKSVNKLSELSGRLAEFESAYDTT